MVQARQYDKPTGAAVAAPLRFTGGSWSGRQPEGILTFVGEWATREGSPTPNLNAALADAAFLMGLEKNADTVVMECYAPLLVNVSPEDPVKGYPKAWQWSTNLIGYDALRSFGSPSYYAQVMFGQNQGDVVLPANLQAATVMTATDPTPHGAVGVGTWNTQVEYKDIVVTAPDGRTLLTADLTRDTRGWQFTGGRWDIQDQAIKPSAAASQSWAITGDPSWTDYTIHLRARKLGGREGFLVLWHATDGDNNNWWNIGGWRNTMTRCEATAEGGREPYGPTSPFKVETGRWYDLRLEVRGHHVRGFIDGNLVTDATEEPRIAATPAFASATYATASHTIIVKVVNAGKNPLELAINLRGAVHVDPKGTATVLAGDPKAVNTLDQPTNVAPKQEVVTDASASFRRTFPPYSFTLLRLTASPQ
jgi:alpha-L-arabinofuranosidase